MPTRGSHGRIARSLATAGLLTMLLATPAVGHAAYSESDPADESTVGESPSSVWAEFTEPPAQDASSLTVYDPCGTRVDGGDSQATGYRVTVSMSATHAGEYRVDWEVFSSIDGHTTRGSFTFTATAGPACPSDDEPAGDGKTDEKRRSSSDGGGSSGSTGSGTGDAGDEGRAARSDARQDLRGDGGLRRDRSVRGRGARAGVISDLDAGAAGERAERAPEDNDIPLDGLVIALAIAGVIGAAGGYVYAGIMGPKR